MVQDPTNSKPFPNAFDSSSLGAVKFRLTPKLPDSSSEFAPQPSIAGPQEPNPYFSRQPSFLEIAESYYKVLNTMRSQRLSSLIPEAKLQPLSLMTEKLLNLAGQLDSGILAGREKGALKCEFDLLREEVEASFDRINFGPQAWMIFQQMQEGAFGSPQPTDMTRGLNPKTTSDSFTRKMAVAICLLDKYTHSIELAFLNGIDLITLKSAKRAIDQISELSSYFVNHPIDGFMLSPDGNSDSMYADVARENLMSAEAHIRELDEAQVLVLSMVDIFGEEIHQRNANNQNHNKLGKAHRLSVKTVQRLLS